MKQPPASKLRGTVRVRITGERPERLLNALTEAGIVVWEVRTGEDGVSLKLLLGDFYRLRPFVRGTGCRVRITKRDGLPFRLARLWKRKFFAAGVVLFAVLLFLLCSLVWSIRVEGNQRLAREDILDAARREGLSAFQWIWRLEEPDKLSKKLASRLPGVSWVGIQRSGTVITIQVVEADLPPEKPLSSPRHLVSRSDAVVTDVFAEQGRPVVSRHARVKKGQILISGTLGDEENSQSVVAKGTVKGLVWHEYEIAVPLTRTRDAYTGGRKDRTYLVLGNWAVQLWGYGREPYAKSRTLSQMDPLTWRGIELPVGVMTEKEMEVGQTSETVTAAEAKREGLTAAMADIAARYGTDSVIRSQKILHEKKENGKVYMKVLFEVEEVISQELPIVYNQGE
ncbi:sporulation protein YqfD [Paenibacillus glufosinatiresistens]|uniref:sporulation protein YqfD n=1 Tax=Paenibacillus glufosinatiresistens TaxID=3070657 RepID=UPI00286D869F|nr:sporulation protein YqfD [Paenibacillus sp. YX.27]